MNNALLPKIGKAKSRIETITSVNENFLQNAKANPQPKELETKLEFDADSLIVSIFNYVATARPRIVRVDDKFYVEYLFSININDSAHEVTRFYVGSGGWVFADAGDEDYIFEYDDENVATHICSRVAYGILESQAFAASKKG